MHLIRHSLKYVPRRDREHVARDLKPNYHRDRRRRRPVRLERFDEKWGQRFPVITQAWLNAWEYVTPFLAFPPEVRRVIYTTQPRAADLLERAVLERAADPCGRVVPAGYLVGVRELPRTS